MSVSTVETAPHVRGLLGAFLFSGDAVEKRVGVLSGGERSRLALSKLLLEPVNFLILDEPTNHLDVDAREALVQALNGYDGAVILISHDRHMIELTADRLVLVENGGAADYSGSIDDYIDFVLGRNQPRAGAKPKQSKNDRKAGELARREARALKQAAAEAEAASARLAALCSALDRAMFDPESAEPELASLPISELGRRREKLAVELKEAEARWLQASEQLDSLAA
jgi:ATP-binding cassette subfamily F protein 3